MTPAGQRTQAGPDLKSACTGMSAREALRRVWIGAGHRLIQSSAGDTWTKFLDEAQTTAPGLPKGIVLDRARLIVCGLLAEVLWTTADG
jgi:hypothetical protein